MCFVYKCAISSVRNNFFLILGLFLGVAISSFMSGLVQNKCIFAPESSDSTSTARSRLDNDDDDDYQPVINLAGKPSRARKTPQDFQRPRYYRTELGMRDKFLAAVLTSPKTARDFGSAFNATSSHLVDKIIFFSESERNRSRSDARRDGVVQFPDSRLNLKTFHALKYLVDNFLGEFDFFLIVRDRTYVRVRELVGLARRMSVSEMVHAGMGRHDPDSSFCSIDFGILLSNSVLQKLALKLDWCLKNSISDSDDNNLGKCIVHSSGVPCSNSVQGIALSSFRLSSTTTTTTREWDKLDNDERFVTALAFWPVNSPNTLLKLHAHFAKVDLLSRRKQLANMRKEITKRPITLPDNSTVCVPWPVGNSPPLRPVNRFDVLHWQYFTERQIFLKSDFSNVDDLAGADLADVKYVINASVEYVRERYKGKYTYKRLVNGYRRFDPSRGMDYILDLAFRDVTTGKEMRRRLEICKPLGKVELIPMPYVTETARVNIVVPVDEAGRKDVLRFMENYVAVCMEKKDRTHLLLVLLYEARHPGKGSRDDVFAEVKKAAVKHSERFRRDDNKIAWLSVKLPDDAVVSRDEVAVGLNRGIMQILVLDLAARKFSDDHLILFATSSMEIRQDYLNRVRMNTIRTRQVFSPIPFAEFDPDIVYGEDLLRPKEMDVNRNYGHYDALNTEHISFYVRDYKEARKSIEEFVPVVHADKDLADLALYFGRKVESAAFAANLTRLSLNSAFAVFVASERLNVLRAVEPGLRLRHARPDCVGMSTGSDALRLPLYKKCVERRNANSGSRSQLGHFILEYLRGCGN